MVDKKAIMIHSKVMQDFLEQLGCTDEESSIYIILLEKGELTTLELARQLHLPRTSIYRKLEEMKQKGFIEEVMDQNTTKAKAASVATLERMVEKKTRDIEELQSLLPNIKESILANADQGQSLTEVQYFKGREAVSRMAWRALSTKDLFRGYSYRQFSELIGFRNALVFKEEWNNNCINARDIYSDEWIKSRKETPNLDIGTWQNWESRYLPASMLNLTHQLDIYDDYVAIYNWHEEEIFGVLIKNKKVADLQKQIFDIVWQMAQPEAK